MRSPNNAQSRINRVKLSALFRIMRFDAARNDSERETDDRKCDLCAPRRSIGDDVVVVVVVTQDTR